MSNIFSQTDTRYDSDMNLPFNSKEGDVNPQTGGISVTYSDITLPGRADMKFTFSRIWTLNQSNLFNMYLDPVDYENRLDGNTLDKYNGLGVGWSSNIPYIYDDVSSGDLVKSLFLNGGVYEIDQSGVEINNANASNLLGYDLTDKRIYKSSEITYGMLLDFETVKAQFNIDSFNTSSSEYVLVMSDNAKYFFDSSGNLMMHQDKTGLNRIWYMYNEISGIRRLALAVDSIGRKIRFNYDSNSNLKEIEWDVELTVINDQGQRELITDTRRVLYNYKAVEKTVDYNNLLYNVSNYREQYCLDSVTDPEGNVTKFTYVQGRAGFTYDSSKGHNYNLFNLLTSVSTNYSSVDGVDKYKNKRVLRYDVPTDGLYQKPFYNGYMEYFKVTNSHYFNRNGKRVKNRDYTYFQEGTANNYLQYSTEIKEGSLSTTYRYSLSSERSKYQTLKSVSVISDDKTYKKLTEYVYDSDRKKTQEDVWIDSEFAYSELFRYNKKSNLEYHLDRNGLTTKTTYWEEFSEPKLVKKTFKDESGTQSYTTENIIFTEGSLKGLVKEKKTHISTGIITDVTNIYDIWGNVTESTDALGHKTVTVFDSTYNAFPVKEYQEVTISNWDAGSVHDNWLTEPTGTVKSRLTIFRVFNSDGSIWIEFDNAGYAIEHYYDKLGNEIETVNPDADDNNDFLATLTDNISYNYFRVNNTAYNSFINSRYNNPGTRILIDHQNDLIKNEVDFNKAEGGLKKTGIQYDGLGNIEEEIVYNGDDTIYSVKTMVYDSYGRMVALTDQDASGSPVQYNAGSNEIINVDLYNKTWIIKYDQAGRKRKIIYPATTAGRNDVKRITYNDSENSMTTVDPLGRTLYERKDWSGNKIEIRALGNDKSKPEDQQTYLYEYDALKRKVKFTDPMGLVTKYVFDERSLLKEQIYYDTPAADSTYSSDRIFYDNLGQIEYKIDRKGQVLHFEYDELKRNISVKHYSTLTDYKNNFANPVREVKSDFDARGNTVRVSNESLIEHYKYDYANRVELLDRHIKDATIRNSLEQVMGIPASNQVLSFSYIYNDGGLVTSMQYPDGAIHTFNYNNTLGYLTGINQGSSIHHQTEFIKSLEYNKSGVITKMNYANNTSQEWSFDNRKRISRIKVLGKDSTELERLEYKLNGIGDVDSINKEYFYQYDGFGRVTGAQTLLPGYVDKLDLVKNHFGYYQHESLYNVSADIFPVGTPDGIIDGQDHVLATFQNIEDCYDMEEFTYDKNGNRKTLIQNKHTFTYTYGDRNRLMSIRRVETGNPVTDKLYAEYEYDSNGNTRKRTIYGDSGNTITTFNYDTLNRLLSATVNGKSVHYQYDNAGNRFIKTTLDKTTIYLRHGQVAVAMDVDINTDKTTKIGEINRYVLSGDLTAGRIKSKKNSDLTTDTSLSFYHLDHLNSTKMVSDQNGDIDVKYIYRAFGEQLKKLDKSGAETNNDSARYSYGGKELDADTNLYYFNARYYDATLGRFINVDPVQDGTNWYVYCNNNPMNMVDPSGLIFFAAIIKAVIKAIVKAVVQVVKFVNNVSKMTKAGHWLEKFSKTSKVMKSINNIYNTVNYISNLNPGSLIKSKLKSLHHKRNANHQKLEHMPQSRAEAESLGYDGAGGQSGEVQGGSYTMTLKQDDGSSLEAVYGEDGQLTGDGSYNFRDKDTDPLGHFILDVAPEWLWGKNQNDEKNTLALERISGIYERDNHREQYDNE